MLTAELGSGLSLTRSPSLRCGVVPPKKVGGQLAEGPELVEVKQQVSTTGFRTLTLIEELALMPDPANSP